MFSSGKFWLKFLHLKNYPSFNVNFLKHIGCKQLTDVITTRTHAHAHTLLITPLGEQPGFRIDLGELGELGLVEQGESGVLAFEPSPPPPLEWGDPGRD
jgi:hypothetical protein